MVRGTERGNTAGHPATPPPSPAPAQRTRALLGHGASDGRPLHLALGVHNHARIVLKVDKGAVLPPPRFSLADDHDGVHCETRREGKVNESVWA